MKKSVVGWMVAVLCFCAFPPVLRAADFPTKPVTVVVPKEPGGAHDITARGMANVAKKYLGQPMLVEIKPGGGGAIGAEYVAKQPADGYTILLAASGLGAVKALRPNVTIDPWRDFAWVTQISSFMLVLTVHPALPARNLKDLIALAKARPGQLSYGSSGVGATPHLNAEYFKAMAKIEINHVPYKGSGGMYLDLMSGRIEMGTSVLGGALPHIKSGRLRALGVSGSKRSPQAPDIPTIAEAALPGYEFLPFYALVVPAGTPREVIAALADAVAKPMSSPEFREQFERIVGADPAWNTPEQMLQVAKKDAEVIEKIVRTANIKVD